jgi:hypothetical protein
MCCSGKRERARVCARLFLFAIVVAPSICHASVLLAGIHEEFGDA